MIAVLIQYAVEKAPGGAADFARDDRRAAFLSARARAAGGSAGWRSTFFIMRW
jgi:hypothetical protein